jgi:SAM-dependent methyltransferase
VSTDSVPLPPDRRAAVAHPTDRALSFGSAAAGYAKFRPGYPQQAVRCAVGLAPDTVLDLGAGTGKLTAALVALRDADSLPRQIIAVEPDEQMLAALRRAVPGVRTELGSAEQIPVPDSSVQVITVGQAMHWFQLDAALPEMSRVLRPGGRLAALWNSRDPRHEFTMAFEQQMDAHVRPPGGSTGQTGPPSLPFSGRPEFTDPELTSFPWLRPMTRDQLHGLLDTLSYVITAVPQRRRDLHNGVDALIDRWAGPLELAEVCQVWVAHRR